MARWSGNPDFDLFRLPDEHNELRAVLRDLCEKEIAPYANTGSGSFGGRRHRRESSRSKPVRDDRTGAA